MQMRVPAAEPRSPAAYDLPDATGHFGPYGGTFVAETLQEALGELREAYEACRKDAAFNGGTALRITLRDPRASITSRQKDSCCSVTLSISSGGCGTLPPGPLAGVGRCRGVDGRLVAAVIAVVAVIAVMTIRHRNDLVQHQADGLVLGDGRNGLFDDLLRCFRRLDDHDHVACQRCQHPGLARHHPRDGSRRGPRRTGRRHTAGR